MINTIRRIFLGAALLFPLTTFAQPVALEIIKEIEMPRDQIFDTAALWIAESTKSSKAAIELKDKDIGTVVASLSSKISGGWGLELPVRFKLKIDVKDRRYRLTFSQVTVLFDRTEKPIEDTNRDFLEPRMTAKFNEVAASLHDYLTHAEKGNAW